MTTAIAWGSIYSEGNPPQTSPYTPGNSGIVPGSESSGYVTNNVSFGVTEGFANADVYFTPVGGERGLQLSFAVSVAEPAYFEIPSYTPGIYEVEATSGGEPLAKKLIAAVSPTGGGYAELAWYEEDAVPAVSIFWTRHVNTREVQS